MNCKPGNIAMIIKGRPDNIGRIVFVASNYGEVDYTWMGCGVFLAGTSKVSEMIWIPIADHRIEGLSLTYQFCKPSDLPDGTLIRKLLPSVVKALSAIGLHEPVSLTVLPGKWWVANVDQSAEDPNFESGCCTVRVVVSTEQLQFHYGGYYCELIDGPFDSDKMPE